MKRSLAALRASNRSEVAMLRIKRAFSLFTWVLSTGVFTWISAGCGPLAPLITTDDAGGGGTADAPADAAPSDAADAASGALGFVPSNVDLSKLDLTNLGDVVVDDDCGIFTTNGHGNGCFTNALPKGAHFAQVL